MRRELRLGVRSLRRRPLLGLIAWSVPEALPAAASGLAIARAVDSGFLAGRPVVGLAWLGAMVVAAGVGAIGSRQVFRRLGDLVEPFRDDLVRRVVAGALRNAVAGRRDDGAIARLTRQVEIVRDTYAGLIVVVRSFAVTVVGVVAGLLSVAPVVALLVLPPFLLGLAAFTATLGFAAARQRAAVLADERLAGSASSVLAGARDLVAAGAEGHGAGLVAGPIREQTAAERALARVAALRTLCFALGGWAPLLVVLLAGPWLAGRGLTAGAIMGGLTYVLFGLQPALQSLIIGLGGSGLKFVVTLGRILDASEPPPLPPRTAVRGPDGVPALVVRGVTFAYGPHAEPVLRDLDLDVPPGTHLAVVGPSGIGKSTLAALLCGLRAPDRGTVSYRAVSNQAVSNQAVSNQAVSNQAVSRQAADGVSGGPPNGVSNGMPNGVSDRAGCTAAALPLPELARMRVLIPQEAYVFAGTIAENLTYLHPAATDSDVGRAVDAIGAGPLVARLGGLGAVLTPGALSAGERQLLALVRAYLSPAPVVVLDEATCHLDPAAERRVEEAFAARGTTLVVIAHRVSSALRAGRVLVLDGAGATAGDHATLLATSPLYRDLLGHWQPRPREAVPISTAGC